MQLVQQTHLLQVEWAKFGGDVKQKDALDAADMVYVVTTTALFNKKIATTVVGAFGGNVSVNQLLQDNQDKYLIQIWSCCSMVLH